MNNPTSNSKSDDTATIEQVVDGYIASLNAGVPADFMSLCHRFAHLMPMLAEELEAATRIHEARMAAAEHPLTSLSDDFASAVVPDQFPPTGCIFDEYELIERVGHGGFGVVFRAQHLQTGMLAAVKILRPDRARDPEALQRFLGEAHIAQKLDHENIVTVSKVGQHEGQYFIVMAWIDSLDLHRFSRGKPLPPRQAAEIMLAVAKACHHAHVNGVIHRDIKPENILVDNQTHKALVTDFGLAKRLDAETPLSGSLQQLGTLHYMAPEQADRQLGPIGPACDIYGVGATLYYLLSGRPPFPREPGTGPKAVIHEILWEEPSRLPVDLPKDLRMICRKCLEKMPIDRYASAAELVHDFEQFIAGKPISGQLPGAARRLSRFFRRRPRIAASLLAVMLSVGVGAWLTASFAIQARDRGREVVQERAQTKQAETQATRAQRRQVLERYVNDLQNASAILASGDVGRTSELLAKYEHPSGVDPRGFEWHYLRQLCAAPSIKHFQADDAQWNRLTFDASGERLAAVDRSGALVIWDLHNSKEVYRLTESVHSVVFSSDGKYFVLLLSSDPADQIQIRDTADGHLIKKFKTGRITTSIAIHPDGSKLLTGSVSGDIHLWALPSGKAIGEITAKFKRGPFDRSSDIQHGAIHDLAFNFNGQLFTAAFEDGAVQVWNLKQRTILSRGPPDKHVGAVTGICFSPDGKLVASQGIGGEIAQSRRSENGRVMVWERATGKLISTIAPHLSRLNDGPLLKTSNGVIPFGQFRPVFTSDGKSLLTTGPRVVQLWDVASGKLIDTFTGHDGLVVAVALSPDGKRIAGASANGSIRVWPVEGDRVCSTVCSHEWGVHGIAISPDGKLLAAACESGADLAHRVDLGEVWSRTEYRSLRVWDARTGRNQYQIDGIDLPFEQPIFISNTLHILAGGKVYDLSANHDFPSQESIATPQSQGEEWSLFQLVRRPDGLSAVSISPDGKWVAIGGEDHSIQVRSILDGKSKHQLTAHQDNVTALAFSPNGLRLASGGMDRHICIWDLDKGTKSFVLRGHNREITGIAFSPDGHRLVSSSGFLDVQSQEPGQVLLWDMETGLQCLELEGGVAQVYCGVAFSADSNTIFASANALGDLSPGRIVAWSTSPRDGRELLSQLSSPFRIAGVESPR